MKTVSKRNTYNVKGINLERVSDNVSNGYKIELRYSCIYVSLRNTLCFYRPIPSLIVLKTSAFATGTKLAYPIASYGNDEEKDTDL